MKWYIVGVLCISLLCRSEQYYHIKNNYNPCYKEQSSHFSISVKPGSSAGYHKNTYASNVYLLSRWSAGNFACAQPDTLSEIQQKNILEKLEWYRYPGFRQYIKQLLLYEKYTKHLYNKLHCCKRCKKKLLKKVGSKKFESIVNELYSQAQRAGQKRAEQQRKLSQQKQQTLQEKPRPPSYTQLSKEKCKEHCNDLAYNLQSVGFSKQHQNYIEKRKIALQNTVANFSNCTKQTYLVSLQANNFLQSKNADNKQFTTCCGNELQQVLHTEFVDIIEQAAQLQTSNDVSSFSDTVLVFAYVGSEHNNAGYILQAFNCADFCHALLEYGSAVVLGAGDAVTNIAHMVVHPIETVKGIAHSIGIISYYFAKICKQYGVCAATCLSQQSLQELGKTLVEVTEPIATRIKNMSGPELARTTTALAVETYLTAKCLKGIHKVCKRAGSSIRKIIAVVENPELVELPATVLATPEGVEIQFVRNGLELAGSESLELVESLNVYLRSNSVEYLTLLEEELLQNKELFEYMKLSFGEYENLVIKGRPRHIFDLEVIGRVRKSGTVKIKPYGFHHDYLGWLENKGVIQLLELEEGVAGTYRARLVVNGVEFNFKTFFPKDWRRVKVIEKIIESTESLINEPRVEGRYVVLEGKTSEKIVIQTVVDVENKALITAYPIVEKNVYKI